MNRQDLDKFVEVFVDFIKDGKTTTPNDEEKDYVISKINPVKLEMFERFLSDKSIRPDYENPDDWDRFYDNTSIDTIDKRDLAHYNLPEEKIKIDYNWYKAYMNGLYHLAQRYVEACEKNIDLYDNNLVVGYEFSKRGVWVFFCAPKGTELNKTCKNGAGPKRIDVNVIFNEFLAHAKALLMDYKKVANEQGVYIEPCVSRAEATVKVINGKEVKIPDPDHHSGRWFSIGSYDITSNANSSETNNPFTYELFNIVRGEYKSKRRPDAK